MINKNEQRICGNCKFNGYDYSSKTYVCNNTSSEMYGCYNAYADTCEDFESNERS